MVRLPWQRKPTIWVCRSLTEYTDADLQLAAFVFGVIGRGDLYIA